MRFANAFFAATRSGSRFHFKNCRTSRSSLVILFPLSQRDVPDAAIVAKALSGVISASPVAPVNCHSNLTSDLFDSSDFAFRETTVHLDLISNFHLRLPFSCGLPATTAILPFTPHIIAYFPLLAQGGILPLVLLVENAPSASSTNVYRRKIFSSRVRPSIVGRKCSSKSRSLQPRARALHFLYHS